MTAIFDGHNDALLRLWRAGDDAGASFIAGGAGGQIDLPLRAGWVDGWRVVCYVHAAAAIIFRGR